MSSLTCQRDGVRVWQVKIDTKMKFGVYITKIKIYSSYEEGGRDVGVMSLKFLKCSNQLENYTDTDN